VALEQVSTDETTALIVGAGNCTDIPIKKLATMFKKVRLVDLDKDAMMAAVKEIDPALQEKIEIVQADISGITGDYARAILGSSVATSQIQFIDEVVRRLCKVDAENKPPDLGTNNTFVSSHLVMTELGSIPFYLLNAVAKEFKMPPLTIHGDR